MKLGPSLESPCKIRGQTGKLMEKRRNKNPDFNPSWCGKSHEHGSDGKTGYDNGDCASSVNGGSAKSSEGISPVQLSKFCHECGTKYPVEWAKFCCECGIRRMAVLPFFKEGGGVKGQRTSLSQEVVQDHWNYADKMQWSYEKCQLQ
ncbi:hypothetical protein EK904_011915 [Melospiza melodia maxima]|nr:hypothetical protein EK904_011915 [Melospiza melodia maxima]